jgi:hypothetical protein
MTFDDDSLFLQTPLGRRIVTCRYLGMDWPPPERVVIGEVCYLRESFSAITDEQRENMTHVMRGALYNPELNS